jgi:hypothetical protein
MMSYAACAFVAPLEQRAVLAAASRVEIGRRARMLFRHIMCRSEGAGFTCIAVSRQAG